MKTPQVSEFDYSSLPESQRRKLYACLQVLETELWQTQSFILRALGRAGLRVVPAEDMTRKAPLKSLRGVSK